MLRTLLTLLLFLACWPLKAEPAATGWVRDSAHVLTAANRTRLEALLDNVKQQTTAEVMVITVPSLGGEDIDPFATRMFNQIGIGRSDTHNGVMFLIAPNERRTRIEVGYGLESLVTDDLAGRILDNHVISRFRQNDMEGGVIAGTEAIAQVLLDNPDAASGVSGSAPNYVRTREGDLKLVFYGAAALGALLFVLYFLVRRSKRFPVLLMYGVGALTLGIAALIGVAWYSLGEFDFIPLPQAILGGGTLLSSATMIIRQFRRYRPRYCESCRAPMRLLEELDDDKYLDAVQRLEERLKSVDYDVWCCPACLKTDTERYVSLFSSYKRCPKCEAQTFREIRMTLVRATRSHGGKVQIDGNCASCKHKTTRIEHTARISSSSGSSGGGGGGGSSGGGRSGGGGASRSW